jgi:hypothetical protein
MQDPRAGRGEPTGVMVARAQGMTSRPATRKPDPEPAGQHTGISNRETPQQEQAERETHPPVDPNAPPPPQDAAGRVGEDAPAANDGRQTSHKAGSRSIAQKEDDRRYPDGSMPPTRKVSGAFGKEPQE